MTPNPNHTSAPKSAVMIVYHHSGQVKVQNRNWNLTLSVFWMMKTGGPRGRSATRSPHHSVCARPAVAHRVEPSSRPPHVPVDGRFRRHSLSSGRGGCLAVAAGSKPNLDTSMAMTDRSTRLYVPA